jgi:hypothetical protein
MSGVIERTEHWGAGDKILDFLCSKVESNVFARQVNKGMSMLSEVFNKYPYEPTGAKEATDAGDVYWYQPILNFLCLGFMGDMAFILAPLS